MPGGRSPLFPKLLRSILFGGQYSVHLPMIIGLCWPVRHSKELRYRDPARPPSPCTPHPAIILAFLQVLPSSQGPSVAPPSLPSPPEPRNPQKATFAPSYYTPCPPQPSLDQSRVWPSAASFHLHSIFFHTFIEFLGTLFRSFLFFSF